MRLRQTSTTTSSTNSNSMISSRQGLCAGVALLLLLPLVAMIVTISMTNTTSATTMENQDNNTAAPPTNQSFVDSDHDDAITNVTNLNYSTSPNHSNIFDSPQSKPNQAMAPTLSPLSVDLPVMVSRAGTLAPSSNSNSTKLPVGNSTIPTNHTSSTAQATNLSPAGVTLIPPSPNPTQQIPTLQPATVAPTKKPTATPAPVDPPPTPAPPPSSPPQSKPTQAPSQKPTNAPSKTTKQPNPKPTALSTNPPTKKPATNTPTKKPTTSAPVKATSKPTTVPTTSKPTQTTTNKPTAKPTQKPTAKPTLPPQPTPSPTTFAQHYQERHSTQKEFLDLLPWEVESLENLGQGSECHPPDGVAQVCCLGGYSSGGDISTDLNQREQCALSMRGGDGDATSFVAVDRIRDDVLQFLAEHALPPPEIQPFTDLTPYYDCDVCQILETARRLQLKLAFMGDSTQNQIAEGLACELERRGYLVTRNWELVNQDHDGTWFYRRHLLTRTMQIRSPLWQNDDVVTMHYHQIYLLPLVETSELLAITANADVVILGFGLHWWYANNIPFEYRKAESYQKAMSHLLSTVRNQGHVQLLVHREASAEHFDAPGGDWFQWEQNRDQLSQVCEPLDFVHDDIIGWRERAVAAAAAESGYDFVVAHPAMAPYSSSSQEKPELVVLPYLQFSANQYTMHPYRAGDAQDCTHYCSTPFLYMPLWRSLRLAMDRRFAAQP